MKMIDLPALTGLLAAHTRGARVLVALAGAPGSGKSTLAEELVATLNRRAPGCAAALPMDGYHYDDTLLRQLGRYSRKGAPDTFDVEGLRHMLARLRNNDDEAVAVPVFDRDIEIARAGACLIPASVEIIVVEGNYLLLRRDPWAALRPLFDLTVMITATEETLHKRLTARWQGFALPREEVVRKVEEVDIPNGRFVKTESVDADFEISQWRRADRSLPQAEPSHGKPS